MRTTRGLNLTSRPTCRLAAHARYQRRPDRVRALAVGLAGRLLINGRPAEKVGKPGLTVRGIAQVSSYIDEHIDEAIHLDDLSASQHC